MDITMNLNSFSKDSLGTATFTILIENLIFSCLSFNNLVLKQLTDIKTTTEQTLYFPTKEIFFA